MIYHIFSIYSSSIDGHLGYKHAFSIQHVQQELTLHFKRWLEVVTDKK